MKLRNIVRRLSKVRAQLILIGADLPEDSPLSDELDAVKDTVEDFTTLVVDAEADEDDLVDPRYHHVADLGALSRYPTEDGGTGMEIKASPLLAQVRIVHPNGDVDETHVCPVGTVQPDLPPCRLCGCTDENQCVLLAPDTGKGDTCVRFRDDLCSACYVRVRPLTPPAA